jgi:hypothetical protein
LAVRVPVLNQPPPSALLLQVAAAFETLTDKTV